MHTFDSPAVAADAIRNWLILNQGEVPAFIRVRLMSRATTGGSVVDLFTDFVAAVYANRDEFDSEAKDIAGGVADLCDRHGYHGRLQGDAPQIAQALWRDAGIKEQGSAEWPDPETDPPANPAFVNPDPPAPKKAAPRRKAKAKK